ncbi:hypothetical protein DUI87_16322 [Hirundo rustica rustica]|uniref:Uncharacterized protein n=1 Tax=Hirundo rustica rustica TaxID=333673 RepID=A0A3M0K0W1_HIRRU|nr:hypothetical protein DUI87_16322 [Hirundo rustica rustica]
MRNSKVAHIKSCFHARQSQEFAGDGEVGFRSWLPGNRTFLLDCSSSLISFSGHIPAPRCLCCSEGPRPGNRIQGVWPPQCGVQGDNQCPGPAGRTRDDTGQVAICLLGHLGTLLDHLYSIVSQDSQALFHWEVFQTVLLQPVVLHGIVVTKAEDLAPSLAETHTDEINPSSQPVDIPFQSLPTFQQISFDTQLGVVCEITEGGLNPLTHIIKI